MTTTEHVQFAPADTAPDIAPGTPALPPVDTSPAALAALTATLATTAERYDRTGDFPWEPLHALHRAGILTLGIGPQHGGRPLTATESARVLQALGQGDPSVALLAAMTIFQHLQQARRQWWPEDLYRAVVADSLTRPVLINAIRAEPELGAPARGGLPATKVRRTAHGWLLNGHKGYGTGSEGLAYHAVWAATEDDEPLTGHVIVPGDHPGIEVVRTWDHFGLRASSTHDVIYRDVEVPAEHFRGAPAGQAREDPTAYAGAGIAVSALYLGVARAAQEFFLRFAHERVPTSLGRPIATTERIQTIAGEIEAQLVQAEEIVYGLAARIDAGDPEASRRALIAKLLVTRSAVTAVQTAVTSLGNPGLTRSHPLERHLRDVQCSRVHPPQDDAALIAFGKQALARAAPAGAPPPTPPAHPAPAA
ncbi:MAG TPA: acyl-CoA dehydrogenase family protein [Actinocrinis sp.]|nr:acyl-CoA dehydrogenase family protein [Actinocrinis sp.]